MDLLRELPDTRQVDGEPKRRWFSSPELDLIVWLDESDAPSGFQLCYDKTHGERALTWRAGRGFDHMAVDDGEQDPAQHKSTPILVADGEFDYSRITKSFIEASGEVPADLRSFVMRALERYRKAP